MNLENEVLICLNSQREVFDTNEVQTRAIFGRQIVKEVQDELEAVR